MPKQIDPATATLVQRLVSVVDADLDAVPLADVRRLWIDVLESGDVVTGVSAAAHDIQAWRPSQTLTSFDRRSGRSCARLSRRAGTYPRGRRSGTTR